MFVLAGGLMNEGGVTYHLVRFSQALVGHMTGGMGNVAVMANMIVSGMTGSSVADASATGSVMITCNEAGEVSSRDGIGDHRSIGLDRTHRATKHCSGNHRKYDGNKHRPSISGWSCSGMSYGSSAPDNELHRVEAKRTCSDEKIRWKRITASR